MPAVIPLCVFSAIAFCLCARALVLVAAGEPAMAWKARAKGQKPVSARVARTYFTVALSIMMAVSFLAMISGFTELFALNLF